MKALYTTPSVAYGWAGALMRLRQRSGKSFNSVTYGWTDEQTNGQTDGPTDRVTYRVACLQLKREKKRRKSEKRRRKVRVGRHGNEKKKDVWTKDWGKKINGYRG